jgi:hypothetical protein
MTASRTSWSKLSLLLSLLLLAPRVGLAAEDAPLATPTSLPSEVPGTQEHEPPRLLEEPATRREKLSVGLRLLVETGAGLMTSTGGLLAGGLIGYGLCEVTSGRAAYIGCAWGAVLGILGGVAIGYPLGVWWGGEVVGGDGSLLASFAGMGVGILAGVLLGLAEQQIDPGNRLTGAVVGLPILAGPLVFYELSQRQEPGTPAPAVASARPRLQPLLTVSSRGALLGLGGTF